MDSAEQAALSSLDQSENAQAVKGRGKRTTTFSSSRSSSSNGVHHHRKHDHHTRTKRSSDLDNLDDDYYGEYNI